MVDVVVVGVDLAGVGQVIWTALPGWTKKPSALVLELKEKKIMKLVADYFMDKLQICTMYSMPWEVEDEISFAKRSSAGGIRIHDPKLNLA